MTPTEIAERAKPVLKKYQDKIVFAYLFGSAAGDTPSRSGDIDIAVYLLREAAKTSAELMLSLHADACRALGRNDIDPVVLNRLSNIIFLAEIIRYSIVLLDQYPAVRENFELNALHLAIDFRGQRLSVMGV